MALQQPLQLLCPNLEPGSPARNGWEVFSPKPQPLSDFWRAFKAASSSYLPVCTPYYRAQARHEMRVDALLDRLFSPQGYTPP